MLIIKTLPDISIEIDPNIKKNFEIVMASLVAQLVKNLPAMLGDHGSIPGLARFPWRRDRLPTPVFMGFPGGSAGKESTCNVGDLGLIPGLGKSLEGVMATHSSILAWRIPMDTGAWWATVHGATKSRTWLSD